MRHTTPLEHRVGSHFTPCLILHSPSLEWSAPPPPAAATPHPLPPPAPAPPQESASMLGEEAIPSELLPPPHLTPPSVRGEQRACAPVGDGDVEEGGECAGGRGGGMRMEREGMCTLMVWGDAGEERLVVRGLDGSEVLNPTPIPAGLQGCRGEVSKGCRVG